MNFRVKLRIKSVNPCYPVKPAPVAPGLGRPLKTNQELLDDLYEAAKMVRPTGKGPWTRRLMDSPGLPDPHFNATCSQTAPHDPNVMVWG